MKDSLVLLGQGGGEGPGGGEGGRGGREVRVPEIVNTLHCYGFMTCYPLI